MAVTQEILDTFRKITALEYRTEDLKVEMLKLQIEMEKLQIQNSEKDSLATES